MTVTLTYDGTLSRVRVSAPAPGVRDTFGHAETDEWGDAETGQAWLRSGGSDSHYSVSGGAGRHSLTAVNSSRWCLAAVSVAADSDHTVIVSTSVLATGGSHYVAAAARSTDTGTDCYLARLDLTTAQAVILSLRKRVASTETQLVSHTTGLTHSADGQLAVRLQVVGTTLRARAWDPSGAEPTAWDLTTTDSAVTAAGRIGVRSILSSSNSNSLPVTAAYHDFYTNGTAMVQRSTDTVRWTTVRGGSALDGTGGTATALDDYEFTDAVANHYRVRVVEPDSGTMLFSEQNSITPTLTGVWIKSVARPFLNRQVTVQDYSDVERPSRAGVFAVVGRTMPVAVTDVSGSRRWSMYVLTTNAAEAAAVDALAASGDILLVHTPTACDVPGGYVAVGDTAQARTFRTSARRIHTWPVTEVATPAADVVGTTVNWQAIVNDFATWSDVLAAFPTWSDVLDYVASPADVIVP